MAAQYGFLLFACILPLYGYHIINSEPPNPREVARMARYVIHNTDWVALSTISTIPHIKSYPFSNLKSMSDGPVLNGTGVPYFYISPNDLSAIDIVADARCSIVASLAETDYCEQQHMDPQDPRCARLILTGHFVKVNKKIHNEEYNFAKNALFARHPNMKIWPTDHHWYIGKIDIEEIIVLDNFGGMKHVDLEDYFKVKDLDEVSLINY